MNRFHNLYRRYPTRVAMPLLPAVLLAAVVSTVSAVGLAQEHPPELIRYAGTYRYAKSREQGEAIVAKAIDRALSDLNVVMKALVKKAMGDRKSLIELITIATPPGQIIIGLDKHQAAAKPGITRQAKTPGGKPSRLTHTFKNGRLEQIWEGERGTFRNVFTLRDKGKTLQRDVTISGGRLSRPIRYRLLYKRQ